MKKEDRDFAAELMSDAGIAFGIIRINIEVEMDKLKCGKKFRVLDELMLYAFKRGQAAECAAIELEQPFVESEDISHIEIRAAIRLGAGALKWCAEKDAELFAIGVGVPGRFEWAIDFGKKDGALEYAEWLGEKYSAFVTNRIGEV